MNIQYRITLIFVLLTVGIVLVVNSIEYYFANQNTFEDFYKRLEIRAFVATKIQFEKGDMAKSAFEEIRKQHLEKLPQEKEYILPLQNIEQRAIQAGLQLPPVFFAEAIATGTARYRNGNVLYLGHLYQGAEKHIVILSATNEFIDSYLDNLRRAIVFTVLSAAIVSALIGLWFSKVIMRPVRVITKKMNEISGTQLHLRLDGGSGKDEISKLTDTFNDMLNRLETTFESQKNFISNASHELNTPLTAIIGESEFALNKLRTPADYQSSITVILTEAERLKKITNSLLHLAQTGYISKSPAFDLLRTDEVLYTVKETVENIIPGCRIYINLTLMPEDENKLLIKGNAQLLEIAFVNLLLNGCKYSQNKPVKVTLAAAHKKVIVIIEDEGIGIPAREIQYIYEPFFRASNTGKFNGYGIGLPLTRNIIRIHNGELDVTSEENIGTKIKVTLPLSGDNR
jgi:signal transduction histidine kinase